jgi:hypothetical protein
VRRVPSLRGGRCLCVRIASNSIVLHHCCMDTWSVAAASCMAFLSQPSTSMTRLYFWWSCLARLGGRGIAFHQGGDVLGDGHVVSVG